MARRVIVTGATGFVGGALTRRLVADGWDVTAMVRDPSAPLPCPAVAWPTSGDEAVDLFGRLAPEVCFHLATRFQPRHTPADVVPLVEGNVTLAALVGEGAASVEGCGVVYTTSYWQHFEGAGYSPTSLYAAMKQAGADVLRYYAECADLPVLTLTLFNTYGPGEPTNRITSLLVRSALEQNPVGLSPGDQLIDLLHLSDVVDAVVASSALVGSDGERWLGFSARADEAVSLKDLAAAISDVVGTPPLADFGALPYRPREMFTPWETDPDLPGWAPAVELAEGLADLRDALLDDR